MAGMPTPRVLLTRADPPGGEWQIVNLSLLSLLGADEEWIRSELLYTAIAETLADSPKARLVKRRAADAHKAGYLCAQFLQYVSGSYRFVNGAELPCVTVKTGDVLHVQHGQSTIDDPLLGHVTDSRFNVNWELWCEQQGYREAYSADTQIVGQRLTWLRDVQKTAAAGGVPQLQRICSQGRAWEDRQRQFMEAAKFLAVTSKMREFVSSEPHAFPQKRGISWFPKALQAFLKLDKNTMWWIKDIVDDIRVWVHLEWADRETNGVLKNNFHQQMKQTGAAFQVSMVEMYCDFSSDAHMCALTALKVLKVRNLPRNCISRCM